MTFNSSKYVTATLDSIAAQDYEGPLELIVSDDGSTDNTIAVCNAWAKEHRERFTTIKVLQTPHNLGICGNYNFALEHVTGEWVKYLAGDDILTEEALSTYIRAARETGDKAFCCGVETFNDDPTLTVDKHTYGVRYAMKDELDSDDTSEQYHNIVFPSKGSSLVEGPTLFIHTASLRRLGGMDMTYPMLEDYPFAVRWLRAGNHLGVIKIPLVKYRVYSESVSQKHSKDYFREMYYTALYDARIRYSLDKHRYIDAYNWKCMREILRHDYPGLKNRLIKSFFILTNIKAVLAKLPGHRPQ
ncbi:MAG: glycosyltransferase [Candidatus Amulumruptor caecigallinarius]|nr:glycosyltransferase [Candidatus Amulumruptor caecigallinarius]MCM1397023.1 glycosyltransferase [Candidatus Amulumruptor caecigallinarius]MCM1454040.1 glycosyltransferase [bacterium]